MGYFNQNPQFAFASFFPRPNHPCVVGVASILQQGKLRHHRFKSLAQDDTVNLQQHSNKAQESYEIMIGTVSISFSHYFIV